MVTSLLTHIPLRKQLQFWNIKHAFYYDQYRFIIEMVLKSPKCLTILEYLVFQ